MTIEHWTPDAPRRTGLRTAAGIAAALAATAVVNGLLARRAERRHPPGGRFVEVDGTLLHYLEKGDGPPVVLIHGNIVTAEDFEFSGLLDRLAVRHRVIAFDRPGMGFSERPRGTAWTPAAQAALLRRAFAALGIERPVVLGHSLGSTVAAALGMDHPEAVGGLVLLAGYYYPTARVDAALTVPVAVPVLGDVLRYTVSPLAGAALMPVFIKGMFTPQPIPERFSANFAPSLSLRPWQIRAMAEDGTAMVPAAAAMQDRYAELTMPVAILAGREDKVADADAHSARLHRDLPHSTLHLVPGAGHMVHYAAPGEVVAAVEAVQRQARGDDVVITKARTTA